MMDPVILKMIMNPANLAIQVQVRILRHQEQIHKNNQNEIRFLTITTRKAVPGSLDRVMTSRKMQ